METVAERAEKAWAERVVETALTAAAMVVREATAVGRFPKS